MLIVGRLISFFSIAFSIRDGIATYDLVISHDGIKVTDERERERESIVVDNKVDRLFGRSFRTLLNGARPIFQNC